jgi:uncharacterized membrane protein YedE/YeeE
LLLQVTAAVVVGKRKAAADVAAAAADTVVVRGSFGVGAVGRQLAVPAGAADRQPMLARQLVDFGLSFWNAVAAAVAIAVAAVVAVVAGRETQGIP